MRTTLSEALAAETAAMSEAGTFKRERVLQSPQGSRITVAGGGEVLNMCANDYLGLANHPQLVAAATSALSTWGFGVASVRFICGTQSVHRELEARLSAFLGTDDTILYSSCFDANTGLFETLLQEGDAVISDALNHASIIDGVRLCKATRHLYANNDMEQLEACLQAAAGARRRVIATDGVFSMDGYTADLRAICELADRYDAIVMVDDSHAVGFIGRGGRGTHELLGVTERVDILTGTLGKALGGASGGYVSGRQEIVDVLRQRSRPYLFSNSLAPPIAAASLAALDLVEQAGELRERLAANTAFFRERMTALGFDVRPGDHPIVPVIVGDAGAAAALADALLEEGTYAMAFSYPVVPQGEARIRTQVTAAHARADLAEAARAFAAARERLSTS